MDPTKQDIISAYVSATELVLSLVSVTYCILSADPLCMQRIICISNVMMLFSLPCCFSLMCAHRVRDHPTNRQRRKP